MAEEHPRGAEAPVGDAGPHAEPGLPSALARLLAIEADERSLRRLVSALADAAAPEADSAALLRADGDRIEIVAAVGLDEGTPEVVSGGIAAEALARGASLVRADPGAPFPPGTRCGAAAPLRVGGPAVLLLGTRSAPALGPDAHALLAVAADRAGHALELARLGRERDRAEEAARRAAEEMDTRRRTVDFILGIVGHDLRNPLGAIHMSAALMQKRGALEGWQARAVDRMRSSAGRMARIIADLLSYTRTRLGNGIPITRRASNLEEIVRRAVDELAAANPDRTLVVDAQGDLGGDWDPDRLEQVVSNLVSNAIDHGDPSAPVRIELSGDAGDVRLVCRNQGPPMPPEVLSHLFEPFSRPPDEKSRKGSGLGLGLYISREIVRGHGGEIGVETDENETRIAVRLPRVASAA